MVLTLLTLAQVLCAVTAVVPIEGASAIPTACAEDTPQSILLLQVRAHSKPGGKGDEDVLQLLTTAEGTLAEIVSTANETLSTGLTNTLTAMNSIDAIVQVAQTAAQTVSAVLGSAGSSIVEELTKVVGEMHDQLSDAEQKVKDLSKTVGDALHSIHAAVNGTANSVLQRFLSAGEQSTDVQTQAAAAAASASNASSGANSSGNTSLLATSAGLLKRGLAVAELFEASLADGCLTHSEVEGAIPSLSFLDVDVTDAMAHFSHIDTNADGCVTNGELARMSTEEQQSMPAPREAIAMLIERASRSGNLEGMVSTTKLEEAVQRKGGSPCDNAKAAINRVNSSISDLQTQMETANATLIMLLEEAGGLASDVLSGMNETVQAGVIVAKAAGLPQATLDPVNAGVKKLLSTMDTILKSMDEAQGAVSAGVAKLLHSLTASLDGKLKDLVTQVSGACDAQSS